MIKGQDPRLPLRAACEFAGQHRCSEYSDSRKVLKLSLYYSSDFTPAVVMEISVRHRHNLYKFLGIDFVHVVMQECRMDAVLVLRVQGGNDIFLSVTGSFTPSFFGISLPSLATLPR